MSGVNAHTRIRVSPNVYCRAFGEELVLLDFGRGEYFALDEIGAHIFRALENGATIGNVTTSVSEIYEVEREVALGDIVLLVTHMHDEGLITLIIGG